MKMIRKKIATASIGAGLVVLFATMNANAGCGCSCKQHFCCDPWEGPYLGINFGAGSDDNIDQSFRSDQTSIQTQTVDGVPFSSTTITRTSGTLNGNATGSTVNLFVGYNFHPSWYCSRFVLGAQLEGTVFSGITYKVNGSTRGTSIRTQTTEGVTTVSTSVFTDTLGHADKLNSTFALVGRAGYLALPCLLVYGLAGGVEGNFVLPCCNDGDGIKRSKWQLGYTVGAGLEYRINDRWSILAEYRYLRIDVDRSQSSPSSTASTAPFTSTNRFTENTTSHFKFNLGQIGIVYHLC